LKELEIETAVPFVSPLDHNLAEELKPLARLSSTSELLQNPLYQKLRPEIDSVLNYVAQEQFATGVKPGRPGESIMATAWNLERGIKLEGIIRALAEHPVLSKSDVLLLTELDYGMARTGNRNVTREIAGSLGMNYAFAPCYLNLAKGSGLEARAGGTNRQALHGNAILARFPLEHAHSIALPNGKDKMRGTEKRLGSQRAVIADLMHPLGTVRVVSVHLDAHSTQRHRHLQMKLILDHLETLSPQLPVVIGGDWNTTTYNSKRAPYAIAGFFRRVMMGVDNILDNHYPHPYRWFERALFREIERRGYGFRNVNQLGVGTLHYDVEDLSANTNMREWVPDWCFWFMRKALAKHNGRASLKLDWFAARDIKVSTSQPPIVVGDLKDENGPLSDHDAIVLNFNV
jgi:endonuclease/exonuclease/phosphatase family metal-dependent hydrolase